MNNFPRLPTGRGTFNAVLFVLCLAFIGLVCLVVAFLVWLIGKFS